MELFKVEDVNGQLSYEITLGCSYNEYMFVCTIEGFIYRYKIIQNKERNSNNIELKFLDSCLIKKDKKISKIIIVECDNTFILLILIDDHIYFIKNSNFPNYNLISKNVDLFTINENRRFELLLYGQKKKKLYFYKYVDNNYKLYKDMQCLDILTCFLWINNSLFLAINKNYYLQDLCNNRHTNNNNNRVLLYSHEFEQTYKYITLINIHEIFIVCDLNIGVFYDVETSMPSRKNTIILPSNIIQLISFRFFLCCLSSKGVLNFYNTNNQQHIQTIDIKNEINLVVNFVSIGGRNMLGELFNFENNDEYDLYNSNNNCGFSNFDDFGQEKKSPKKILNFKEILNETVMTNIKGNKKKYGLNILDSKDIKYENSEYNIDEEKMEMVKLLSISDEHNYLKNCLYIINNNFIKVIKCIELYKHLPKCIEQNKIETGFLLIENNNFENEMDKINILHEYNKACAYFYFKKLNFSLAFMLFEKVDINIFFLLSFWANYFNSSFKKYDNEKDIYLHPQDKTNDIKTIEENISKPFKQFVPIVCTIYELIERGYHIYSQNTMKSYMDTHINENDNNFISKQKILSIANICLTKYILKKRDFFIENKYDIKIERNIWENITMPKHKEKQIEESSITQSLSSEYIYIDELIDNILIKLMVNNNYKNFTQFIMKTPNLNLNINECIQYLKENHKFIETILIYIRFHNFDVAIKMCISFLHYYKLKENNDQNDVLQNEHIDYGYSYMGYEKNGDDQDMWWCKMLDEKNFKNNIERSNTFHSILKEIYNVLIILNGNVHLINIEESGIKKLFEYSFPFLLKYNEKLFYDFIINNNLILRPHEILLTFKKLQDIKLKKKINYYIQKYVMNYIKYDKKNKNVNAILLELYINDSEKPVQVRQKKILKMLRSNYPIDTNHIIQMIENKNFNLVTALLYGRIHKHYESLEILCEEDLGICEKYCHYYSFMLKCFVKGLKKEKYESIFSSIYNNDKTIYQKLVNEKNKNNDISTNNEYKQDDKTVKKNKKKANKISDAFIKDIIKEYHKYSYITMNKNSLEKIKKLNNLNKINDENIQNKEENIKKEYDYMLHLIGNEKNSSNDDDNYDITNYYDNDEICDYSSQNTETNASTNYQHFTDIENENTSDSLIIDYSDEKNNINIQEQGFAKKKKKKKNGEISIMGKKSQNSKLKKKKDKYKKLLGNSSQNQDIDLLEYFHVYNENKCRSCGFFFLFIKVCMDKYKNKNTCEIKKEIYKNYIIYILNKYANHNDLNNIYIFKMIPENWKISKISNYVNFYLRKKLNTRTNLEIYHNLIKSSYLNVTYNLIKKKEEKILIQDSIVCNVCNTLIEEKEFVYFSENVVLHIKCVCKYNTAKLT
ncbi:vacuolar protein sorting-associated protein 3, putative [Plasmodium berghei]|uniref:Vacuolar protein sorting-associated protein 3, putative n=2 Tax=Plasmodium berghei TaxID=5821 RepID=A0A509AMZ2_PLABA|nr:vacuolar protein sorting-associated protein 3, putative [Plasmodium berghei ANKA]CXI52526.1 vacuolar protein sorting-associated protein 3, putative [Plasmodium berghei]SCL94647.1 vacuolar protein sorting-associated protein 3, putative [Plasmodium berghei]SCM16071.1 vacuolar protein sorting-associated protein 3, putative [Plasmodium berghei]SCN26176.1 vacuolar protein sorting-associated protein 3, putative [Plasmodium berghei]VUC56193.1 vacuolar protein sorting-associated protein 3, putative|eukprot:XP_034421995.1 vacuolar protein sorting-associated protein 3, putative [Plasmodium berghei ANKA]